MKFVFMLPLICACLYSSRAGSPTQKQVRQSSGLFISEKNTFYYAFCEPFQQWAESLGFLLIIHRNLKRVNERIVIFTDRSSLNLGFASVFSVCRIYHRQQHQKKRKRNILISLFYVICLMMVASLQLHFSRRVIGNVMIRERKAIVDAHLCTANLGL